MMHKAGFVFGIQGNRSRAFFSKVSNVIFLDLSSINRQQKVTFVCDKSVDRLLSKT